MSDEPTDETADIQERARLEELRRAIAEGSDAIAITALMNEGILERSGLDLRTYHLVRAAAHAACGSPPAVWSNMAELVGDSVSDSDLFGTLVAIAPIIGRMRSRSRTWSTGVDSSRMASCCSRMMRSRSWMNPKATVMAMRLAAGS